MKKLKLSLDELEVDTFIAEGRAVYGMDGYSEAQVTCGCPLSQQTRCLCTDAEGCYLSLYCTGVGAGVPYHTCAAGCMTNALGDC